MFELLPSSPLGRMHQANEARLVADQVRDAKELLSLAEATEEKLRNVAMENAISNRAAHLVYEQELMLKGTQIKHEHLMDELAKEHADCIASISADAARVLTEMEATRALHGDKVALLEASFEKDLVELRRKFDSQVEDLIGYHENELRQTREDLELKKRVMILKTQEERNMQFNAIADIHRASIDELNKYYAEILEENHTTVNTLQAEIDKLVSMQEERKGRMAALTDENTALSAPLNEVEMKRNMLRDQLDKVHTGKLAYRNFKQSLRSLDTKHKNIQREIALCDQQISSLTCKSK